MIGEGHLRWRADTETWFYRRQEWTLTEIKAFFATLVTDIEAFACKHLLFRPEASLDTYTPQSLKDDMTLTTNNQCFVDLVGNNLVGGVSHVVEALSLTSRLARFVKPGQDGLVFDAESVKSYALNVQIFLEYLAVLVFMTMDQSPDAVFFLRGLTRNSWTSMRNYYVHGGAVMYVNAKPGARTSASAGFLPQAIGRLYVAYVADIEPFLHYLQASQSPSSQPSRGSMPILFAWETDMFLNVQHMNDIMKKVTTSHFAFPVDLDLWGQIALSINRDLLDNHVTNIPAQFGWGEFDTCGPAISSNMLANLIRSDLPSTQDAARRYHQSLGFDVGPASTLATASATSPWPSLGTGPLTPAPTWPGKASLRSSTPAWVAPSTLSSGRRRSRPFPTEDSPTKRPDRTKRPAPIRRPQSTTQRTPQALGPLQTTLTQPSGQERDRVSPTPQLFDQEESRRNQLREYFRSFVQTGPNPVCPPCWLEYGYDSAGHTFASCNATTVDVAAVLDFKRLILWKPKCHWMCGAPRYICRRYEQGCDFVDILLPVMLFAYHNPKYLDLLRHIKPSAVVESEADFARAISEQIILYDTPTSVAVALFDMIVRSCLAERETESHSDSQDDEPRP